MVLSRWKNVFFSALVCIACSLDPGHSVLAFLVSSPSTRCARLASPDVDGDSFVLHGIKKKADKMAENFLSDISDPKSIEGSGIFGGDMDSLMATIERNKRRTAERQEPVEAEGNVSGGIAADGDGDSESGEGSSVQRGQSGTGSNEDDLTGSQ